MEDIEFSLERAPVRPRSWAGSSTTGEKSRLNVCAGGGVDVAGVVSLGDAEADDSDVEVEAVEPVTDEGGGDDAALGSVDDLADALGLGDWGALLDVYLTDVHAD
jgi:hypothetical protein